MQFLKPNINVDFISKRNYAFVFSAVLLLGSIAVLWLKGGPRYGIDFSGGTLIQVKFTSQVQIADVHKGLSMADLSVSTVQSFGEAKDNEFLIRIDQSLEATTDLGSNTSNQLKQATGVDNEIRRIEIVGPQVGKDLKEKALLSIFYSLLFITIYISGRFEYKWILSGVVGAILFAGVYFLSLFHMGIVFLIASALVISLAIFWFLNLKYAIGAVVALIHDVLITVGVFAIFDKEFSLPVIAALLTILGYSLNDTIIVYDRIRENLSKSSKGLFPELINRSINETLSRTILTGGCTLVMVLALFIFGGTIIHDFSFAMLVGIIVGTYSSIYVASPILLIGYHDKK